MWRKGFYHRLYGYILFYLLGSHLTKHAFKVQK